MAARPEYRFYNGQPFRDLTGVPPNLDRGCAHGGCRGTLRSVPGTQSFDADGGAQVHTRCDTCAVESAAYWEWTSKPPALYDR